MKTVSYMPYAVSRPNDVRPRTLVVLAILAALALANASCNKVLPTYKMPFSKGWGAAVRVSMPIVVAESALLPEAPSTTTIPAPVTVTNADGSTTTTQPPPVTVEAPVALTINAVDATGAPLENITVMVPALEAQALCDAYCAGTNGWSTCWDARVHSLKSCPILAVGLRGLDCLVACYFASEPQYRADYFAAVHGEKYSGRVKATKQKCGKGVHVFGADSKGGDAAVSCVLVSFLFMP